MAHSLVLSSTLRRLSLAGLLGAVAGQGWALSSDDVAITTLPSSIAPSNTVEAVVQYAAPAGRTVLVHVFEVQPGNVWVWKSLGQRNVASGNGSVTIPVSFTNLNTANPHQWMVEYRPQGSTTAIKSLYQAVSIATNVPVLAAGNYRIRNGWGADSYLNRAGVQNANGSWSPGNAAYFSGLQTGWSSQIWAIEQVGGSVYRLKNSWTKGADHLERSSKQVNGTWVPDDTPPFFGTLGTTLDSQKWILEWVTGKTYRVRNAWSNGNDFLGRAAATGTSNPGSEARQFAFNKDWTSTQWTFDTAVGDSISWGTKPTTLAATGSTTFTVNYSAATARDIYVTLFNASWSVVATATRADVNNGTGTASFALSWSNLPAGTYKLKAEIRADGETDWTKNLQELFADATVSGSTVSIYNGDTMVYDMSGALYDSPLPDGVPISSYAQEARGTGQYDWARNPRLAYGKGLRNDRYVLNALNAWGQLYLVQGVQNPPSNVRVQLRNMRLHLRNNSNQWTQLQYKYDIGVDWWNGSSGQDGNAYAENFQGGNGDTSKVTMWQLGGLATLTCGGDYCAHFFPTWNKVTVDANNVSAIWSSVEARLVDNNGNPYSDEYTNSYILSMGCDASVPGYVFDENDADRWYKQGDVGVGRFKYVKGKWQTFNMHTYFDTNNFTVQDAAVRNSGFPTY